MSDAGSSPPSSSPEAIDAVPLRHPWRWVAAAVIIVLVGLFLYGAATNPAYGWSTFGEYLFNERILLGVFNTLQLTVYSMVIGIVAVWPRILPDTTATAPNSPMARALHSNTP